MQSPGSFVFEWPLSWESTDALRLLEGTVFQTLLLRPSQAKQIRATAEARGYRCIVEGEDGFRWRAHGEMDWAQPGPCVAINDAFWPSVAGGKASEDGADAGPTGSPWLDANGWLILLARARAKGRAVWIRAKEPESEARFEAANYRMALAEACAYGAVRPLWLAPRHAAAVGKGEAKWWGDLCADASWWKAHAEWQSWPVTSRLVISSDFSGANEYLAGETLLLAARRNLAFQPVPAGDLTAASLRGKKALLWLDPVEPPAFVEAFVRSGGLLICRKSAWKGAPIAGPNPRFQLQSLGAGRIALAAQDWDDPWILAQDVHLIVSRRHDPVRIFNQGLLQQHIVETPDRSRQLVHILNYALQPSWNLVTLVPSEKVSSARCHLPPNAKVESVELRTVSGRQEILVPKFPIALTLELELQRNA